MDYIALLPLNENGDNEDGEVWFYRYFEDEEDALADPLLEYIDSNEELETVSAAFDEFLDSSEYDELLEDLIEDAYSKDGEPSDDEFVDGED